MLTVQMREVHFLICFGRNHYNLAWLPAVLATWVICSTTCRFTSMISTDDTV